MDGETEAGRGWDSLPPSGSQGPALGCIASIGATMQRRGQSGQAGMAKGAAWSMG